jgi:hypothetical protein
VVNNASEFEDGRHKAKGGSMDIKVGEGGNEILACDNE